MQKIDFTKLLGFDTIGVTESLDLQNEAISDKLGAKIGPVPEESPPKGIDFADENLGAKLGAKVGIEVTN